MKAMIAKMWAYFMASMVIPVETPEGTLYIIPSMEPTGYAAFIEPKGGE